MYLWYRRTQGEGPDQCRGSGPKVGSVGAPSHHGRLFSLQTWWVPSTARSLGLCLCPSVATTSPSGFTRLLPLCLGSLVRPLLGLPSSPLSVSEVSVSPFSPLVSLSLGTSVSLCLTLGPLSFPVLLLPCSVLRFPFHSWKSLPRSLPHPPPSLSPSSPFLHHLSLHRDRSPWSVELKDPNRPHNSHRVLYPESHDFGSFTSRLDLLNQRDPPSGDRLWCPWCHR